MTPSPKARVEDGDDDLDDLDDVLDQFTPPPQEKSMATPLTPVLAQSQLIAPDTPTVPLAPPPTAATTTTTFSRATTSSDTTAPGGIPYDEELVAKFAEDFAAELSKGMESLMREIGGSDPGSVVEEQKTEEQKQKEQELRAAWEAMLIQGMGENGLEGLSSEVTDKSGVAGAGKDKEGGSGEVKAGFQNSIRQAMERLKESESTFKADSSSKNPGNVDAEPVDAFLAKLSDSLGTAGSEEELTGLLESMMTQLMSKDVLYDALKDLHDKFPSYLEEHASTLSTADKLRYKSQLDCVSKIIKAFDEPTYSDQDAEATMKIVNLMTEMQSFGSPPAEIMGPIPPEFTPGPDGMPPQALEGCVIV